MDARNNDFDFDFTPIGQAIKKARTSQGMTREQLARIVDYDPRHLQANFFILIACASDGVASLYCIASSRVYCCSSDR